MVQRVRRFALSFCLILMLLLLALAGCSSASVAQKPTTTGGPHQTATARPGATSPPAATATPGTACNNKLPDVPVPTGAVQVGASTTSGATISCAYRLAQDLAMADALLKQQMGQSGWTLLKDDPEGQQALFQEYFKGQSFASITLSQHGNDMHTTDITIAVETSK